MPDAIPANANRTTNGSHKYEPCRIMNFIHKDMNKIELSKDLAYFVFLDLRRTSFNSIGTFFFLNAKITQSQMK